MIAPKHAFMTDDPARAITLAADPGAGALEHPSQMARAKRGQRRQTRSLPLARPLPGYAAATCATCRITYLPSAMPPQSTPLQERACDNCQQTLG